jgi:hypothetical protein
MKTNTLKRIGLVAIAAIAIFFTACSSPLAEKQEKDYFGQLLVDNGDHYVMGGDILLYKNDPYHQELIEQFGGTASRGVKRESIRPWPNGIVHYYIEKEGFSDYNLKDIQYAFDEWEASADLQFIERSAWEPYTLRIRKINDPNIGGSASLGYSYSPILNLSNFGRSTIVHELGHSLGFSHEHQRYDRDDYVTIIEENIRPGYAHNFTKYPQFDGSGNIYSRVYAPYDYESIMHYPEWAFGIGGAITIDGRGNELRGNNISNGDAFSAASVYGQPTSGKLRRLFDAVVFASDAPGASYKQFSQVGHYQWEYILNVTDNSYPFQIKIANIHVDPNSPNLYFGDNTGDGILDYSGEHLTFPSTGAYKITVNGDDLSYTIEETTVVPLTVGFRNPTYFTGETPYIYFWDSADGEAVWPGYPMQSEGDGWFSYTFDTATRAQVIFHDNQGMQSIDLWANSSAYFRPSVITASGKFTGGWLDEKPAPLKLYFQKPLGFNSDVPYIHYWNSTAGATEWPGVPMTHVGNDLFVYEFDQADEASFVFTDRYEWQTVDFFRKEGGSFTATGQNEEGKWTGDWVTE